MLSSLGGFRARTGRRYGAPAALVMLGAWLILLETPTPLPFAVDARPDPGTQDLVLTFPGTLAHAELSADGRLILCVAEPPKTRLRHRDGGAYTHVSLLDTRTGRPMFQRSWTRLSGVSCRLSPDAKVLVGCEEHDDGSYVIAAWDVQRQRHLWRKDGPPRTRPDVAYIALSPDCRTFVLPGRMADSGVPGGIRRGIWIYNLRSGRLERAVLGPSNPQVAFSPDSRLLAATTRHDIVIYDTSTWRPVGRIRAPAPDDAPSASVFSGDGARLFSLWSISKWGGDMIRACSVADWKDLRPRAGLRWGFPYQWWGAGVVSDGPGWYLWRVQSRPMRLDLYERPSERRISTWKVDLPPGHLQFSFTARLLLLDDGANTLRLRRLTW